MRLFTLPKPFSRLPTEHNLSPHAKRRPQWMDFYHDHDHNPRLTCRHFAIKIDKIPSLLL